VAELEKSSREPSAALVPVRFCMRIVILMTFAALGSVGFGTGLAALSAMAAIVCTVVATVKGETAFSRALNHWDEALAYAALYFLFVGLDLSAPL